MPARQQVRTFIAYIHGWNIRLVQAIACHVSYVFPLQYSYDHPGDRSSKGSSVFSGGQMSLKNNGRLIKALVPDAVGKDLDRLREHLGVSTLSNVVAIAIRKLAIAEFQQNAATSSDYKSKEVA
jgi:hypothetical protein